MGKIYLTLKELKELGCPFNAISYKTVTLRLNDVYEVIFSYKGKKYKVDIFDCNLNEEGMDEEEFECVELCN